ncbi:hypothetical protein DOE78_02700 [Bacillus sp. Y1]|nr:hypothetical protein DOE78_02700 [Bacillus sp. Y1]
MNEVVRKYEMSSRSLLKQWIRNYNDHREDGLKDKRGQRKVEPELTPEEKIQREMKRLERENERLRAENAFLKKLEELERRRLKKRH